MSDTRHPAMESHALTARPQSRPPRMVTLSPSGPSGHNNGQPAGAISPQLVLHALRQWWKVAFPLGLMAGALGAWLVYYFFEPTYKATAWLRIESRAPYVAFPNQEDSARFTATQLETMRSPLVLGPVLSKPEIAGMRELKEAEAPIEWLASRIKATAVGASDLFQISFESRDAAAAARVVNGVVESYFELRGKYDAEQTQRVVELLEEERNKRATEVETLRKNVRVLTKNAIGVDPYMPPVKERPQAPNAMTALQQRLVNTEVDRQLLELQAKVYKESLEKEPVEVPASVIEKAVEEHPTVQSLRTSLAGKRVRLGEYDRKLARGAQDDLYRRLAEEIKQEEDALGERRKELTTEMGDELKQSQDKQRKKELASIDRDVESYRSLEKLLRKQCDTQIEEAKELTGETLELEFKRAELARAEKVVELIANRSMTLHTERNAPSRVTKMHAAQVPTLPIEKYPFKKMGLLGFILFCVPFGLAVLWEKTIHRISDTDQLEAHTALPVLAEIARLPVRVVRAPGNGKRVGRDLTVFEESIDGLRTSLTLSETLRDMRVLAVASATSGEGKTSVALQLAVSIARATGQATLLIDGDMRSPDVHRVLGLPAAPGLAEVLAKQATLSDAIVTSWSDFVHVLPAGQVSSSPHRLVGNGELRALVEEARGKYRYVIIDTPPVLPAAEAIVLSKAADAVLICAMRDVSRLDQVQKAYSRLALAGTNPLGFVLNGVPTRQYAYRYGTYEYVRR